MRDERTARLRGPFLVAAGVCLIVATAIQGQSALDTATDAEIRRMTADQRLAQLMIVSIDGETLSAAESNILRTRPPGGIVLYRRHLASEKQAKALTKQIASLSSPLRPFLAVDHEHGSVKRLVALTERLPGNMALGAARSAALAREAGVATGIALRRLGIDVNFAPVLDVARNPRSPIGTRSFGDDPDVVAALGAAFIEGQAAAGIASAAKHFVGEGAVGSDTHGGAAVLVAGGGEITESLIPFRAAIRAGVPAVMTSHIGVPSLTREGNTPITYSRRALSGVLRGELAFDGVIITDALGMRGAHIHDDVGELALWALEAGADMVLVAGWDSERDRVFERLSEAHRSGRLTDARIDESLRRILTMKKRWCGASARVTGPVGTARRIAEQALTRWGASLPLLDDIASSAVVLEDDGYFGANLGLPTIAPQSPDPCVPARPAPVQPRIVLAVLATADQAIAAQSWINANAPGAGVIAIAMGDPRDVEHLTRYDSAIAAYSGCPASRETIVALLRHERVAPGVLPVARSSTPFLTASPDSVDHRMER